MVQFLPMPAIAYPQNAMINFQPMNQALQFYANNQLERGRFGLQQNADLRAQEMHPLTMDQTRAQTGLANAHGDFYAGQNRRADTMLPEEISHRRAQTGLLGAQAGMSNAHARLYDAQSAGVGEGAALRRRQLDSLELQRDRGFSLQMLRQLAAAQNPQQFELVARALAPRLRRMPRFEERDTLLATLGDALEEYDMVPGPDGQVQRISRGFSPDVSAAMRGLDPASPNVAAASMGQGGVGGLRTMVPPQQQPPQNQTPTDEIFRRFPVLAPQPQAAAPSAQPQAASPWQAPMRPAMVVPAQSQPVNALAGGPAAGNGMLQPVAAPGMVLPPVLGGPAPAPAQGGPQAPAPMGRPVPRSPSGNRRGDLAEIEAQYGAPTTWGQAGAQPPPFSIVQRYWQSVHGGRPPQGQQFAPDGSLQPIPGAAARGGGGRGSGGNNAAANATEVLSTTVPQMENAAEYMLGSNVVTNALGQVPGAQMVGVTGFNNARGTLQFGTAAVMHSLSGATTTQREFERYVEAFLPNWNDLDQTRRYKLNSLMLITRAIQAKAAGGSINDATMAPIRRQMLDAQRQLLGLTTNGGGAPGVPAAGGSQAPPSGWGSAGGMSTQDIINGLGRR